MKKVRKWQWLYKLDGNVCWDITPAYLTHEQMKTYVESYNEHHSRPIKDYGKAKVSKMRL